MFADASSLAKLAANPSSPSRLAQKAKLDADANEFFSNQVVQVDVQVILIVLNQYETLQGSKGLSACHLYRMLHMLGQACLGESLQHCWLSRAWHTAFLPSFLVAGSIVKL